MIYLKALKVCNLDLFFTWPDQRIGYYQETGRGIYSAFVPSDFAQAEPGVMVP